MHTCYLILFFDTSSGIPVYKGYGFFGESSLTTDLSGNRMIIDGPSAKGNTYIEAKKELIQQLGHNPFYRWLINLEFESSMPEERS